MNTYKRKRHYEYSSRNCTHEKTNRTLVTNVIIILTFFSPVLLRHAMPVNYKYTRDTWTMIYRVNDVNWTATPARKQA